MSTKANLSFMCETGEHVCDGTTAVMGVPCACSCHSIRAMLHDTLTRPEVKPTGRVHELKCWPKHFQAVKSGAKPFELRYNDRDFQVGDVLRLYEWQPHPSYKETRAGWYTGEVVERLVTYILDEFEEMPEFSPDGWVIMGIRGD